MQFVYKPEGADPKTWDFDPGKLMSPEVEVIEKQTGMTFGEWADAVGKGSFTAIHGLLYVLLKRGVPTLKWDEVQFCMEDIDFVMSPEEKSEARAVLEAKGSLTEEEADLLADIIAEGIEATPEGQAPKASARTKRSG